MNEFIAGSFYDGKTSKRQDARLRAAQGRLEVWVGEQRVLDADAVQVSIAVPVGRGHYRAVFPAGESFETSESLEHHAISVKDKVGGFVSKIELNWKLAATSVLVLIVATGLFLKILVPLFADRLAATLPLSWIERVEKQQIRMVQKFKVFEPVDPKLLREVPRNIEYQKVFDDLIAEFPGLKLNITVINGSGFGANAFALLAHEIMVTDKLLMLVKTSDQLRAVLYHEVGHLVFKHGIHHLVTHSAVAGTFSLLVGDVAGVSALIALVSSSYSRGMETQADQFASERMLAAGKDPRELGRILTIMVGENKKLEKSALRYFSSHPVTEDRVKLFESMSRTKN